MHSSTAHVGAPVLGTSLRCKPAQSASQSRYQGRTSRGRRAGCCMTARRTLQRLPRLQCWHTAGVRLFDGYRRSVELLHRKKSCCLETTAPHRQSSQQRVAQQSQRRNALLRWDSAISSRQTLHGSQAQHADRCTGVSDAPGRRCEELTIQDGREEQLFSAPEAVAEQEGAH